MLPVSCLDVHLRYWKEKVCCSMLRSSCRSYADPCSAVERTSVPARMDVLNEYALARYSPLQNDRPVFFSKYGGFFLFMLDM
jgi:hypothetical protein